MTVALEYCNHEKKENIFIIRPELNLH